MATMTPNTYGWVCLTLYSIVLLIAITTSGLRVYVRSVILKQYGTTEDWVAGITCGLTVAYLSVAIAGVVHGLGRHIYVLPPQQLPTVLKLWWAEVLCYYLAVVSVKLCITLVLLRFVVEEWHRRAVIVVGSVIQIYNIVFVFVYSFQCTPVSFFWTRVLDDTTGHCIKNYALFSTGYTYVGLNVFYDVTMAVLPWFMVRRMQLDLRRKLMVVGVLALGSSASVAVIARIPFTVVLGRSPDITYNVAPLAITSIIEIGLCIVASNAAALKPLFRNSLSRGDTKPKTPKLNTIPDTSGALSSDTPIDYNDIEALAGKWKIESSADSYDLEAVRKCLGEQSKSTHGRCQELDL